MIEVPLREDAARLGQTWVWQQVAFALCAAAAAVLALVRVVLYTQAFTVDVERRCAVIDMGRLDLLSVLFVPEVALVVLGPAALALLGARLVGAGPALRILGRQTLILHTNNRRIGFCGLLGVLSLLLSSSFDLAFYIVLSASFAGVFDIAVLLSRSRAVARVIGVALMANYGTAWLRTQVLRVDCALLPAGHRSSLDTSVLLGATLAGQLLFYLAVLTLLSRRLLRPRRPIAQTPRDPYSRLGGEVGVDDARSGSAATNYSNTGSGFSNLNSTSTPSSSSASADATDTAYGGRGIWRVKGTVTVYNNYELRVVIKGSEPHLALAKRAAGFWSSWECNRAPSPRLEHLSMACFSVTAVTGLANSVVLAVIAVTTGNASARCFDDPSRTMALLASLTRNGMLLGLAQWVRTVHRPWRAIAQYTFFSIVFNHRSLTIVSAGMFVVGFFTAYPVGIVLPTIVIVPALDAFATTMVEPVPRRLAALGVRIMMARSVCSYAFDAVVYGSLCSLQERRRDIAEFLAATLAAALNAAYNVAVLAILSRKVRDFQRPLLDFRLRRGVGYDTSACTGE
jgi:hypothetical protein